MSGGIVGGIVADPPIGGSFAGGQGIAGPPGPSAYDSYVALGGTLTEAEWSAPAADLPVASEADAIAGLRSDVAITPSTLAAYFAAQSGGTIVIPPPTTGSTAGGGALNTADFSDPNNAYLAGAF